MPPHPVVFRGAQIGLQNALNSEAAANIRLLTPGFSRINARASGGYVHTNSGNRLPSATVPPGYHEGEVSFEGPIDFVCALYLFASYFGIPTPSANGTNGQAWDFFLGLASGVDRTFFSYQNGDANRAEKAINMYANSLAIETSKATQRYSGSLRCGKKQRGITLTGSPDDIAPVIIPSQKLDVYYGTSKAALDAAVSGDDKLLTPFPLMASLNFPEVADPLPRMNSDEDSYAAVNDKAVVPTFALKVTDEADFDALADLIDTGAPGFFALRALGNVIAPDSQFEFRADFAGTLIEPETNDEEASAAAHTLTFQNQYDPTWGKAHNIRVVTTIDDLEP